MVLTSDYKSCQMDKWIQSMITWWIMVKSQIQIMARRWVFKPQGADTWLRQANGERLWQLWEASDEAVSPCPAASCCYSHGEFACGGQCSPSCEFHNHFRYKCHSVCFGIFFPYWSCSELRWIPNCMPLLWYNSLSYFLNAALDVISYTASNDPKRAVVPLWNCHGTQDPSEAFCFDSLMVYAPGGKTPVAGAAWQSNEDQMVLDCFGNEGNGKLVKLSKPFTSQRITCT